MTRSLSLAGLPFLGAISTPFYHKRKVQKMKDLPKTWVLTEKQFEDFRQKKEQKQNSRPLENTQWNTLNLNATIENDLVTRQK